MHSNYKTFQKKSIFSHFVTTLNDTFLIELTQEDEGYESGSETLNILHSSQKSTLNIPCINEWEFILQFYNTT